LNYKTALNLHATILQLQKRPVPSKVAYALRKNLEKLNEVYKQFDVLRNELCIKHGGVVSEDQTRYEFTEENQALLNTDFIQLEETEVDVNIHKIDLEDFGNSEVTAEELGSLEAYGALIVKI
jgi:hypothetical protein